MPELQKLISQIRQRIITARSAVARNIKTLQVFTNFEIGRLIVENEQEGASRAGYGKETLRELSTQLSAEFGKGFSLTNLKLIRQFYLTYRDQIGQQLSGQSPNTPKSQTLSDQLRLSGNNGEKLSSHRAFSLSWSHYVFLMGITDKKERVFYEIEAFQQNWSIRELKRQFDSSLYERLALSRSKKEVRRLSQNGKIMTRPEDMLKNPYVLEFLGIDEKSKYSENDLENAVIDKIEHFLLELGKGFLFEARQKRFTFDEEHFFVVLVFYNRLLHCYVLIDLKIGKLTHQDLGQMQMYVNYFDHYVKQDNENPTVGIILCKKKNADLVEITLPTEANIYASEYQLLFAVKRGSAEKVDRVDRRNGRISVPVQCGNLLNGINYYH
ncbi:MAG TPA: PDDEXK nuclease domain-containing protein [Candidatus Marinimicrobia bacterium]|nr:PDDEXK nuclease domain-containing protein [Candidatus Neomarinimicrobiota bacterium]